MRLDDFDFDLPEDLIALRPVVPRSAARLLVAGPDTVQDSQVSALPDWLRPGDRLVLNDTKVIPARLTGTRTRQTGQGAAAARISATLLGPDPSGGWQALIKPLRKVRAGEVVVFSSDLSATVSRIENGAAVLAFNRSGPDFDAALNAAGAMPLPPYIATRRPADERDRDDYQSIWARASGAVAAPTASLHFDTPLMAALKQRGIATTSVTLHVGAGTFLPVKVEDITRHRMHAEWGQVSETAAEQIARTRAEGGRVIAVGTTALRLIETAGRGGQMAPFEGETDIFIYPGFRFGITDGLVTNFHLPKSTLMMLVAALMGAQRIREVYAHAVARRYRFFSYGDASLLLPRG